MCLVQLIIQVRSYVHTDLLWRMSGNRIPVQCIMVDWAQSNLLLIITSDRDEWLGDERRGEANQTRSDPALSADWNESTQPREYYAFGWRAVSARKCHFYIRTSPTISKTSLPIAPPFLPYLSREPRCLWQLHPLAGSRCVCDHARDSAICPYLERGWWRSCPNKSLGALRARESRWATRPCSPFIHTRSPSYSYRPSASL